MIVLINANLRCRKENNERAETEHGVSRELQVAPFVSVCMHNSLCLITSKLLSLNNKDSQYETVPQHSDGEYDRLVDHVRCHSDDIVTQSANDEQLPFERTSLGAQVNNHQRDVLPIPSIEHHDELTASESNEQFHQRIHNCNVAVKNERCAECLENVEPENSFDYVQLSTQEQGDSRSTCLLEAAYQTRKQDIHTSSEEDSESEWAIVSTISFN